MSRKETEIIETAHNEARAIIQAEDPGTAAERLEDLIDYIQQAGDRVRKLVASAGITMTPRPSLNFPDRRAIMAAAAVLVNQEALEALKLDHRDESPGLDVWEADAAAPNLGMLVAWNTGYFAAGGGAGPDPAVSLAVQVLEQKTREVAGISLSELDEGEREALVQEAMEAIAGRDRALEARYIMQAEQRVREAESPHACDDPP